MAGGVGTAPVYPQVKWLHEQGVENCIRTISLTNIEEKDNKLVITFKGDGFLRYQVRNMVGILIKIGENKISPSKVKEILESKDRTKAGKTAPAEGLYLVDVKY